jgi:predicted phage-related endonuclease
MGRLKKDVVKEMVETDHKDLELTEGLHATLVWVIEKKIDYDKLKSQYGNVYELGLRTTFSSDQALKSVSKSLLQKILKDCTIQDMGYKLKFKKGK